MRAVNAYLPSAVIVTSHDAVQQYPEIAKLLDGVRYVKVFESYPDALWLRADTAAPLR